MKSCWRPFRSFQIDRKQHLVSVPRRAKSGKWQGGIPIWNNVSWHGLIAESVHGGIHSRCVLGGSVMNLMWLSRFIKCLCVCLPHLSSLCKNPSCNNATVQVWDAKIYKFVSRWLGIEWDLCTCPSVSNCLFSSIMQNISSSIARSPPIWARSTPFIAEWRRLRSLEVNSEEQWKQKNIRLLKGFAVHSTCSHIRHVYSRYFFK